MLNRKIERLFYLLSGRDKEFSEIKFWRREIVKIQEWNNSGFNPLYGTRPTFIVAHYDKKISALLSFFECHQKPKYLKELQLSVDTFNSFDVVLDIGSGPFPSALCFNNCKVYSLDPLIGEYVKSGYPLHVYSERNRFINAQVENIPFPDNSVDAVICVNAIDHVNDFRQAALEIQRVLKPNGRFRMNVHYHKATKAEPIEIDDQLFLNRYNWVPGIRKIRQTETHTLWGN